MQDSVGSSGDIGVDIFFALSGFLITTVLLEEWDHRDRIGLGRFYLRRILRLYPALLLMVLGCFVIAAVLGQSILDDTVHTLACHGRVLEQLVGRHRTERLVRSPLVPQRRRAVLSRLATPPHRRVALRQKRCVDRHPYALVAVIVVVVAILSTHWSNERLYLGTDPRAPQLLIGAAAALAFSMRRPTRLGSTIRVAAAAGAVYLTTVTLGVFGNYSLPQITIAIAATAIVVCLTDPPAWCTRILGSKPALGLGRISYGVLWQIPLGAIVAVELRGTPPIAWFAMVLPGSIAMAWASYRLVEVRCLRLKRKLV